MACLLSVLDGTGDNSTISRQQKTKSVKPMTELLSNAHHDAENDPLGSLIDADMGAYYSWLGQQRLSGAQQSSFLVWFENHSEALAISPTLPPGTQSSKATSVSELLQWIG